MLGRRELAAGVMVIDTRPEVPIYHARGESYYDKELKRFVWWTRCGISYGMFDSYLPRRLAMKFGRSCRRCYPR